MYRIQSSSKRHLMKLLRGVKLKKTLAATCETSSEIFVPQYFKPKIKKVCHSIHCFLIIELSLGYLHLSPHVTKSSAAKFTAGKKLE